MFARRVLKRALALLPEAPAPAAESTVSEITPLAFRQGQWQGQRINLVLPSINPEHYFGGIHTAVEVFRKLAAFFPATRLIVSDSAPSQEALMRFPEFQSASLEDDLDSPHQIVAANDRYGRTLSVSSGDVFLATAWWTALLAQRAAAFRDGRADGGRIAYLIQDFEPGFYPWSSRYGLALSSYRPGQDFAIYNTALLRDYFVSQGLDFANQSTYFEPVLNRGLRAALAKAAGANVPRERLILLYARPGTPRNAFELACEALREWRRADPSSAGWRVLGLGELEGTLDLGELRVEGLGKLSIDAYADLLSRAAVGLSLMVSPHPSYPPLEMAAFGLRTVTNGYANKNLAIYGESLISVSTLSPYLLGKAISTACSQAEAAELAPMPVGLSVPPGFLTDADLEFDSRSLVQWLTALS